MVTAGNLRGRVRRRRTGTVLVAGLAVVAGLLLFPLAAPAHDASDFFIFAKTAVGPYAENTCTGSGVKHVDISGSTSTYEGRVHSNANLYVTGQTNTFEDALTFGTNGESCDSEDGNNTYHDGDPTDIDGDPTGVSNGWPGDLASYLNGDGATFGTDVSQVLPGVTQCDVGSLTNGSTIELTAANAGDVVCNGFGLTKLAVNNVTLSVTIVSHGPIEVSGQGNSLSPAVHGVLAWTDYELDVAVKFGGSNFQVPQQAIVFSGRGGIDTSGSNDADLCIQLIGQGPIKVPGSNSTYGPGSEACTGAPPPQPDVKITKTGNGTVPVGQTAQFTIEIENIGQAVATNVALDPADTLPNAGLDWALDTQGLGPGFSGGTDCSLSAGDVLSCSIASLAAGAKYRVVVTAPVTASTVCGDKPNTATVTASNEPSGNSGNNSSSDTITVPCPPPPASIVVEKTADPTSLAEPGGDVTFDVVVTNQSSARSVTIDTLSDDQFGDLDGQGDCSVPQTIGPSGQYGCSFTGSVTGDPGFEHTNTVTAEGEDDGGNPVSDEDDATVTITDVPSTIVVTKDADPTSVQEPGGNVTFTVEVENTSAVDTVTIDSLTDSVFGDLNGEGTCDVDPPVVLAPTETYECEFTKAITGSANDTHTNTVTASGEDDDGNEVSDTDDATVEITENPGTVTVKKVMLGGDGSFTFTGTPSGTISENDGTISAEVSSGQHTSTETVPDDWELVSIECDDPTENSSGNVESATASFDVAPGEDVTCTFTNRKKGQIRVEKQALPDGDTTSFEFTGALTASLSDGQTSDAVLVSPDTYTVTEAASAGWDLTSVSCDDDDSTGDLETGVATFEVEAGEIVTCTFTNTKRGQIVVAKETDPVGSPQSFPFEASYDVDGFSLAHGQSDTSAPLLPDTYSVSENTPDGWTLTSATCDDDSPVDAVVLDPGETVTCTFVNTQDATLVVEKVVVNDNGGTATADDFSFQVNGGTAESFEADGQNDLQVEPGTYTVTEPEVEDYETSYDNCSELQLPAGGTATCTITNDDLAPSLTLVKEVVNDDGGSETASAWTLAADGPTGLSGTTPVASGPSFDAGTYDLSETGPGGYTASAWECEGGTQTDGDTVEIGLGDEVTCTITNDDNAPSLTLLKKVVNDNGGTATPAHWTLTATGSSSISGPGPSVASGDDFLAGTYSLSESGGPSGYTASAWECVGGEQNGSSVTVALGDDVTCTITNDDDAPSLRLVKVVVNDNGGTALPGAWTLTAGGPTGFSGATPATSGASFDAGEYDLSESGPAGYEASDWECEGGDQTDGDTVEVGLGEDVTCTITNDDLAPSLTLVKEVMNDNGGTAEASDWDLAATGATSFSGAGPDVSSDDTFDAGSYDLSESGGPSGYAASDWDCDEGQVDGDTVVVGLGDEITCTITNDDIAPKLTLVKEVVNDNGGTAQPSAWTLTATGPSGFNGLGPTVTSGSSFAAGSYDLSESGPAGYDASDWACTGESNVDGDTVAVGLGDDVTCTIVNDDQAAALIVIKNVVNDSGGTAGADDFQMTITGVTAQGGNSFPGAAAPGVTKTLTSVGQYQVAETLIAGYTQMGASADCSGTIALGQTKTCTITNNDVPRGQGSIDVQKSVLPTSVKEPGGPVTYTVRITNTSADVDVTITSIVDDKFGDLENVAGGNPAGCFDLPIILPPGASSTCQFTKQITGAGGTAHVNVVTASGSDENGNPVSDSDDARVDITERLIDLVIVKEATSPTPLNGTVTYSLTVTNKGPDAATNVQVADPAPSGITYLTVSATQGSCALTATLITCNLGSIAAGQTVTITVTARATAVGTHVNTATVTGGGGRETAPQDNVDSAQTVVPAPFRPPTVNGKPKSKPAPQPRVCLTLTVTPKMITADGKPDRIKVRATAGKKRMKGVRVVVRGSGVNKTSRTNAKGVANMRVNPKRAGLVTVTAIETNQRVCGAKRIGVVGVFLPPLTG